MESFPFSCRDQNPGYGAEGSNTEKDGLFRWGAWGRSKERERKKVASGLTPPGPMAVWHIALELLAASVWGG